MKRSTLRIKEHKPLDNTSGSIGTTNPGNRQKSPAPGLGIQSGVPSHVVRHICNRHIQSPTATALSLTIHSIIKILSILAIDGDERQMTNRSDQPYPAHSHLPKALLFPPINRGSKSGGISWERMAHLNFHSRGKMISQNFPTLPTGLVRTVG